MPVIESVVVPVVLDVVLPVIEVSFPPVMVCDIVVLSDGIELSEVMFEDVMFEVVIFDVVAVLVSVAVSVASDSGTSKIIAASRPLAENVEPSAAVDVWFVSVPFVLVPVSLAVPVAGVVVWLPVVVVFEAVPCAIAGPRLNAVAKSPKTSTNATAMGAFFIADCVHERILTIISIK
jgi:hypothetical protein